MNNATTIPGMFGEPHSTCIVCQAEGDMPGEGCGAFCEAPAMVSHLGEWMHRDCVAAFDVEIETGRPIMGAACCVRCQATGGDCCPDCEGAGWIYQADAAPVPVEEPADETAKTVVEAPIPTDVLRDGWWSRLARAAVFVGVLVGMSACGAHRAAPPEVESVGTLTPAYNSIAVAPLKHDAPPEMGLVAGSDDDSTGEVATTTTRTADAGEPDAAPEVVAKDGGLTVGTVR